MRLPDPIISNRSFFFVQLMPAAAAVVHCHRVQPTAVSHLLLPDGHGQHFSLQVERRQFEAVSGVDRDFSFLPCLEYSGRQDAHVVEPSWGCRGRGTFVVYFLRFEAVLDGLNVILVAVFDVPVDIVVVGVLPACVVTVAEICDAKSRIRFRLSQTLRLVLKLNLQRLNSAKRQRMTTVKLFNGSKNSHIYERLFVTS